MMDETEYLLSTPANAEHLKRSIEQLKRGATQEHELIEVDEDPQDWLPQAIFTTAWLGVSR